jgi:hypothetical protein
VSVRLRKGSSVKALLRLTVLTLVLFAAAWPGTAAADPGDPQAFIESPADGSFYPQGYAVQFGF